LLKLQKPSEKNPENAIFIPFNEGMSKNYFTPKGTIHGRAPNSSELENLKQALPLGLVGLDRPDIEVDYGFVTKCGDEQAWALKQQHPDIRNSHFKAYLTSYYYLLCRATTLYLKHGFGGCLVPSFYQKQKGDMVEFGFSFLGSPCPTGRESNEFSPVPAYEENFGGGFFTMYRHFYESLKVVSDEDNFPLSQVIGLDIRQTSQLGKLVVLLIIHGRTVYVCKHDIDESGEDLMLTILADGGVEEFVLLPCLPTEI
jgi:hypothetical protein